VRICIQQISSILESVDIHKVHVIGIFVFSCWNPTVLHLHVFFLNFSDFYLSIRIQYELFEVHQVFNVVHYQAKPVDGLLYGLEIQTLDLIGVLKKFFQGKQK